MKATALALLVAAGCGDNIHPSIDDFLPPVPLPDGSEPTTRAGIATDDELIGGPAATGLAGDFYIANDRVRFVIQAPGRAMEPNPWGGNPIDASRRAEDGSWTPDHMGEVGFLYRAGRTCGHETMEVVQDGSGGGAAVLRARGRSVVFDTINFKGIGALPIRDDLDPDVGDSVDCATTYILRPGATTLEVAWTLFNPTDALVAGPFGATGELGGEAEPFARGLGFFRSRIDPLAGDETGAPHMIFQGPNVAYGEVPRMADPSAPSSIIALAGHSILYGVEDPLGLVSEENWALRLEPEKGDTFWLDLVVARDAAGVEAHQRRGRGEPVAPVAGKVALVPSGGAAAGARVGFFEDADGDGELGADDPVVAFADCGADGGFTVELGTGTYLAQAHVRDLARSPAQEVVVEEDETAAVTFELPDPAVFQHTTVDDATGDPLPVKLTVIGAHPAPRDHRVFADDDGRGGLVSMLHAVYGTSDPAGDDPGDPPLVLPAGGPYRVYATRGPEWSFDSALVEPAAGETGTLSFRLRHVVDTGGYVATEFHQHSLGSEDSAVAYEDRLATLLTEGIEYFASTDHNYLSDYDPLIDAMGLRGWIDAVVGVEATSAVWGHFNGYPLERDDAHPSGGAPDWASPDEDGLDLLPRELWQDMRDRGARVVQINHARALGNDDHQQYFDRVALGFDFEARTFGGDPAAQPVPSSWLRQPEDQDLFSEAFDAIEVWNGFSTGDSDGDGVVELRNMDRLLRDWMNFLSLGKIYTPVGNSDSHRLWSTAAGLPRTLVRVADDSSEAIADGVDDEVYATLLGEGSSRRDVIVTDGPLVRVTRGGSEASVIGGELDATDGTAELAISFQTAEWMEIDTIEVFANATFDELDGDRTALVPLVCFTTRAPESLHEEDPCALAAMAPRPLAVDLVEVGTGFWRREAAVTLELDAADIPVREGATGEDAWLVVRVRGQRAVYPMLVQGVINDGNLAALLAADDEAALAPLVRGRGVPAMAFTAPVLIDFDGGGWTAPFAP
ncbi:MAG TPA: CehA/McbA family metallohydrolase [Kofleriaceae bacterium]|nr:CehA/McbA family metallohydrolase [Kofleriaceae bacterium]